MRAIVVVAGAAALAVATACGGRAEDRAEVSGPVESGVEIEADRPFTLAPGETAYLPGASLSVRFIGVPADSRCPVDVTCVWEGDATVAVETVAGGRAEERALHYPSDRIGPRAVDLGSHHLELIGLEPATTSDGPVAPEAYRATFTLVPAPA